jgi:hypothetical protein
MKSTQRKNVMLVAFQVVLVLVVLFYYYAYTSKVGERIVLSSFDEFAAVLIDEAEAVYYSPGAAKRTIPFDMPVFVERIYAVKEGKLFFDIRTAANTTYFLAYDSHAPILAYVEPGETTKLNVIIEKKEDYVIMCSKDTCTCLRDGTISCDD